MVRDKSTSFLKLHKNSFLTHFLAKIPVTEPDVLSGERMEKKKREESNILTYHIKNFIVGPRGILFGEFAFPASTWLVASFEEVRSLKVNKDVTRNAMESTVAPVLSAIAADLRKAS